MEPERAGAAATTVAVGARCGRVDVGRARLGVLPTDGLTGARDSATLSESYPHWSVGS